MSAQQNPGVSSWGVFSRIQEAMQQAHRYADQLMEGIANAIDLEIWDVAESLAKTLAAHIRKTGEYPADLPKEQMERLVGIYEDSYRFGLN